MQSMFGGRVPRMLPPVIADRCYHRRTLLLRQTSVSSYAFSCDNMLLSLSDNLRQVKRHYCSAWLSGSVLVSINEVTLRRALLLRYG